jgi:wyosine [tRNA(Phe)-imidazoG37] synthetase (radical SAM superfamily)
MGLERQEFYHPAVIFSEVRKHLEQLQETDKPDYITFVANGEPTLDVNLGKSIQVLKQFKIPVGVITNASLLSQKSVRDELSLADWVSVKVDAVQQPVWKSINRPISSLNFEALLEGIGQFSSSYNGKLITETMLIKGINDGSFNLIQTAAFIAQLNPDVAYLSIPTRPPAVDAVCAPPETIVTQAYQIFLNAGLTAELLLGFEGVNMGYTGNAIEDIINICTVHPVREDTMEELLRKDHADNSLLKSLIKSQFIRQVQYNSKKYYIRQFHP